MSAGSSKQFQKKRNDQSEIKPGEVKKRDLRASVFFVCFFCLPGMVVGDLSVL